MFCKNCGNQISENMKFCPVCGKTIDYVANVAGEKVNQKRKNGSFRYCGKPNFSDR